MSDHLKKYWSLYFSGTIAGIMLLAYLFLPEFRSFAQTGWEIIWSNDKERITSWFKSFGYWGPLMIIIIMVLQMFLIVFPTWLPMIVAVLGYGPVWGCVISLAAVYTSSTLGYFFGLAVANFTQGKMLKKKRYRNIVNVLRNNSFGGVVLFRISPFLSSDAVSFVAGIIKMGYWRYILATFIGTLPLAIAIAYFGKEIETLKYGFYWIGGFGILLYGVYIKYKKAGSVAQTKERE